MQYTPMGEECEVTLGAWLMGELDADNKRAWGAMEYEGFYPRRLSSSSSRSG